MHFKDTKLLKFSQHHETIKITGTIYEDVVCLVKKR